MNWALLAGSLAGVLGLAVVARLLGLGGGELADEAEAMRIAEAEMPGFRAVSAQLADDRRSALVTGADGTTLRVRQHGAQFVGSPLPTGEGDSR
jgi:predicted phage tail protein